jgi:hypothetical protein
MQLRQSGSLVGDITKDEMLVSAAVVAESALKTSPSTMRAVIRSWLPVSAVCRDIFVDVEACKHTVE